MRCFICDCIIDWVLYDTTICLIWNKLFFFITCVFRPPPLTRGQHPLTDNYFPSFVTTSSLVSSLPPSFWSTPPPQSVTVAMVTRQPGGGAMPSPCASRCTLTLWGWLKAWTSQKPVKTLRFVTRWPESRPSRRSCVTSCPAFMTSFGQKRRRSGWRFFFWNDYASLASLVFTFKKNLF